MKEKFSNIVTTRKDNIIEIRLCKDLNNKLHINNKIDSLLFDLKEASYEAIEMFMNNEIDLYSLTEVFTEIIPIFMPSYKKNDCCLCGIEEKNIEIMKHERVGKDWICQDCSERLLEVPINQSLDTCIDVEYKINNPSKLFDLAEDEEDNNDFNWGELFDRQVINNVK